MDPREYDWQMGDLADQSNYPPGVDPSVIGTAVKNWWSNQPSWAERAKAENQRTAEAFQRGGMGAVAQQLATDTTEAQDLASAFGAGTLAGPRSLTANLGKYKTAQEMLQYGKTAPEIRKETNWFPIDTRGNLAYEIPDKGTGWLPAQDPSKIPRHELPVLKPMTAPAGRVYQHPAAFEAYPDLANSPVIISRTLGKGVRGGFDPPEYVGDVPKVYIAPASSGQMRSVLSHELLGHGVQNLEQGQTPGGKLTGWSIGDNPTRLLVNMKPGTPQWDIYQRMLEDARKPLEFRDYANMIKDTGLQATEQSYKNFVEATKSGVTETVDRRLRQLAAHEAYRKNAGEEAARAIQARLNFGPRKIQQIPFEQSLSTPVEQQIFRPRPPLKPASERPTPDPGGAAPWEMGSLADQGNVQLSAKAPTGFVPGSVLSPAERTALPKNWRDLPGENAPFPQYAEQYPPVGPPTMVPKDKPKFPGETYPEKTLTPEGEAFVKERNKIMADMKKTPYEPYYDPAQRYNVDPSKYPPANVDTLTVQPKKAKTLEEYEKVIDTPETRKALRDAYEKGQNLGDTANWYAMGQLEADYIKELGSKAGRKAFLDEFAVPTAATTSGNKPINNLLMGHYFEFLRKKGEPIPEGHQFPAPIGGRRANVNVRDYESVMEGGGYSALGYEQPKMHNFSRSFIGDLSRGVMDEQMAGGALAHAPDKAFIDKARTTGFGLLEKQMHTEAKRAGVKPGDFQDVAWAGFKDEAGRPMITEINDTIERTHRLTGMPRSEIVRRGFIKKEIPLYGVGGVVMGGLAAQDEYR